MLRIVLLVVALVLFGIATVTSTPRINLVAAGLALLTAAFLAPSLGD